MYVIIVLNIMFSRNLSMHERLRENIISRRNNIMISGQVGILSAIVIYLFAMVYVGFYFSKKGSGDSADDFYLGGRKLGPFVTAMSAEASDMSSWLLMGLPGVAYLTGIADAGWTAIGLGIGTYLNWLIVAQRLRRYSIICNAITIPDFFSRRFKDNKNILMCISAIIILIFFIPYTASGFKAIGTLFSSLFGTDYHVAMIIGAVVIVGYTVMGGFMAVSTTDLIQSVVMSISLVVIVFYGYIFSRLSFHDPASRQGICLCCTIQPVFHYIYTCMGAWLLRYASYPSSFHGH